MGKIVVETEREVEMEGSGSQTTEGETERSRGSFASKDDLVERGYWVGKR